MANIGEVVTVNERSRKYDFGGGDIVELKNVQQIVVRPSGSHRIKTTDGRLHIIPDGWLHIEIDADDWTF